MLAPGADHLLDFVVDRLEVGIVAVDAQMQVALWNRFMATHSGRPAAEVVGRNIFECFPDLPRAWLEKKIRNVFVLKNYAFTSWEQRPYLFRFHHNRPVTGGVEAMQQSCTFLPVRDAEDHVSHVCITLFDYTDTALFQQRLTGAIADLEAQREEQKRLIGKLEEAQGQLLQSEKLASIGQLAAGVAHEINNPIGFVNSNLGTLDNYVKDLLRLLETYARAETDPQEMAAAVALKREVDLEYLKEDLAALVRESREGLDRVKKIVQDLKDFSRVDSSQEWQKADLHQCIDSTLNVVWNEIKYKAEVVKDYGPLPEVECLPSQLNQVFMNLMVNAAHAIAEKGTITIATGVEGDLAWVSVADTGCGIAPENLRRIFDPFFTTKPVGKGTGLGLSVSHNIVAKHGGRLEVDSEPGGGSTFRLSLPLRHPAAEQAPLGDAG
jgi:signal transduction histidine kinase